MMTPSIAIPTSGPSRIEQKIGWLIEQSTALVSDIRNTLGSVLQYESQDDPDSKTVGKAGIKRIQRVRRRLTKGTRRATDPNPENLDNLEEKFRKMAEGE